MPPHIHWEELEDDPPWSDRLLVDVEVHRELPLPLRSAWTLLLDPASTTVWFSEEHHFPIVEGTGFLLQDGTTGVVEMVRPPHLVRFVWHPGRWSIPALLDLHLHDVGAGYTRFEVRARGIPEKAAPDVMAWWNAAFDRLAGVVPRRDHPHGSGGAGSVK